MKLEVDWVCRNWDFLSQRRHKILPAYRLGSFIRDGQAVSTGRFYGTPQFLDFARDYKSVTYAGTPRLFLRPYIIAPMPDEEVQAVYIDPKKYTINEEGLITGLDSTFESTIFIFKN